jgi:hypothetical protein
MAYGWFVAPFLIGAELTIVEKAADYIANNPPQSDQDRKDIEERIYRSLSPLLIPPIAHERHGMEISSITCATSIIYTKARWRSPRCCYGSRRRCVEQRTTAS